jgi:AcrR family transcriptional regulator
MSEETRVKLLDGALETLATHGIAKASARSIAAAAGVNQALVFYHFGSVDELLAAACRHGAQRRLARYRESFARVETLGELLALGRTMHAEERAGGHVAFLGQLLAGAQTQERLAPAVAAGLGLWIEELERVLERVVGPTPVAPFLDVPGLARTLAASFVGLELYEGVDPAGAGRAFDGLERLADLAAVLTELGPVAQRAVRARLRRTAAGRHGGGATT